MKFKHVSDIVGAFADDGKLTLSSFTIFFSIFLDKQFATKKRRM